MSATEAATATIPSPVNKKLNLALKGLNDRRGSDVLLLTFLLTVVSSLSLRPAVARDSDLWWHLRAGSWIAAHHAVPWHDTFGRYTLGRTWLDYTWLFDLLVSRTYHAGSLLGILVFTDIMLLLCVTCAFRLLSERLPHGHTVALSALYLFAIVPLGTPRPWLFSILAVTIELWILLRAQEYGRPYLLLWLLPLFTLWANLHVQFVYGLGLLFLFALTASLPSGWVTGERESGTLPAAFWWVSLTGAGLSTLINPYGWRVYEVVWEYASQKAAVNLIQEMQALSFRNLTDWAALALFCLALGSLAWSRKKSALLWSFLVAGAWFGFHAERDVWFLAILSAVVVAESLKGIGDHTPLSGSQIGFSLLLTGFIYAAQLHWGVTSAASLQKEMDQSFPTKASSYIDEHRMPDPIFNPYDWGGYLMWRFPQRLVSIDGRAQLYGDKDLASTFSTLNGGQDWQKDPALVQARTIVVQRPSPLASLLRLDPRYRMVYEDDLALLFERR